MCVDDRAVATVFVLVVFNRHGVGAGHLVRQGLGLLETNVGGGDLRCREAGYLGQGLFALIGHLLNNTEIQGVADTGGHTSGLEVYLKAIDTHITFRHLTFDGIQLGGVVGADPGTVAAAETGVRVLQYGAVFDVFSVGAGWAAFQAYGVVAVVTGHGNIQALVIGVAAALDVAYRAEGDMGGVLVLFATGCFTGVAADTVIGGKEETVLLVAVGVTAHLGVFIDVQRSVDRQFALGQLDQVNLLAVAIFIVDLFLGQKGVGSLFGADFPDTAAVGLGSLCSRRAACRKVVAGSLLQLVLQ